MKQTDKAPASWASIVKRHTPSDEEKKQMVESEKRAAMQRAWVERQREEMRNARTALYHPPTQDEEESDVEED